VGAALSVIPEVDAAVTADNAFIIGCIIKTMYLLKRLMSLGEMQLINFQS